jgi:hypothetical protein
MLSSEFWHDFLPAGKKFTNPAPNFLRAGIPFSGVTQALLPVRNACNASARAQAGGTYERIEFGPLINCVTY